MWFDCVLIDHLEGDGTLNSFHIRSFGDKPFPVDRLEDIDPEFPAADAADLGPLRLYNWKHMQVTRLQSKPRNFFNDGQKIEFQLDHFRIPNHAGYYAIIFPKGWRVSDIKIYDPYDTSSDNVAEKRAFRDAVMRWDDHSFLSSAQLEMRSARRGVFSLGVIGVLSQCGSGERFLEASSSLSVAFTDPRHESHPREDAYRTAVDRVVDGIKSEPPKMPGISLGLTGPSINIVEWARYLRDKVRQPKQH